MGQVFFKTASITAGQQFLGDEFKVAPQKRNRILKVREIQLSMGPEAKDYDVQKVFTQNSTTIRISLRADTASTDQDVFLNGNDADFLLLNGEQIQIQTAAATAAMEARIYYEEIDNSPTRSALDPIVTR